MAGPPAARTASSSVGSVTTTLPCCGSAARQVAADHVEAVGTQLLLDLRHQGGQFARPAGLSPAR